MAVNPTERRYAGATTEPERAAEITVSEVTTSARRVSAELASASGFPSGHLSAGSHTFNILTATAGLSPPGGSTYFGVALVEDDSDVLGNYTVSGAVVDYVDLGIGLPASLPASITLTVPTSGVYRVVMTAGNTAANAQNSLNVSTGATSFEYHYDSDGNSVSGGAPLVLFNNGSITVIGALATLNSVDAGDDLRYSDTPAITLNLDPVGSSNFRETFGVRLATRSANTDGSGIDTFDVTPDVSGAVTSGTFNVDTSYPAAPTDHFLHVGVNNTLGNATTPTAQTPQIWRTGTVVGVTTTQRAWLAFDTSGHGTGITRASESRAYDAGDTTIGSGIALYQDSGITTLGALTFDDSGYNNASRLFRRPQPTDQDDHEHPYLQAYLGDAFGAALANTDVALVVIDQEASATEDSQNLTTDGNGRIRWDYEIARSDGAFNRYVISGDSESAAPLDIPKADVYLADPDPILDIDPNYPGATFLGPYPSYPKRIRLTGREYGSAEPTSDADDVFGVNCEIIVTGTWTGSAGQATDDSNNAPTGIGSRIKPLGTGSVRTKTSSEYNEAEGVLYDLSRPVARDVAGRPFDVSNTNNRAEARRGIWNVTLDQQELAETDPGNNARLQGALGYPTGFESISAPADPSVLVLWTAYWDQIANVPDSAWDMLGSGYGVAGVPVESPSGQVSAGKVGWAAKQDGNFGQAAQALNFIVVDPDLNFFVTLSDIQPAPGQQIRITAEMTRLLPSNAHVPLEPDFPLWIKIFRQNDAAVIVADSQMTAVAGTDNLAWEYFFTPTEPDSFAVMVTGFKDGSRPPDAGDVAFTANNQNRRIKILADIGNGDPANNGSHLLGGVPIEINVQAFNNTTHLLEEIDDSEDNEWLLLRKIGNGSTQSWDNTAKTWNPDEPFTTNEFSRTEDGKTLFVQIDAADTLSWEDSDVELLVTGFIDKVEYNDRQYRELVGPSYQHDRDESQNVGIVWSSIANGSRKRHHLTDQSDLELLIVPRSQIGVDALNTSIELSLRRVDSAGASDLLDLESGGWIGTEDEAHPNNKKFIFLTAGLIVFPSGVAQVIIPSSVLDFTGNNVPWFIASARVTYDSGEPEERAVVETVQIEVVGPENPHDDNDFDPTGLFK